MSRVTLRDIAEHIGVDRSTVSRVLSNKAAEGGISIELANRIVLKAREMRYLPNASARAVRTGRFSCAALMLSTVEGRSYLPRRLLDGIHDELAALDQHLMIAKVPDEKLQESEYVPTMLRSLMSDGLLINYTHHLPDYLVQIVEERSLPAVWINTERPHDAVYPQNRIAAHDATCRLIQLGHRNIAFLDLCIGQAELADAHMSNRDRQRGYEQAMRGAGLTPLVVRGPQACVTIDAERTFLLGWLRQENPPTAIVCYATIFLPSLLWATAELGLKIPKDLSVITFASEEFPLHRLPIDALVEPDYQMGVVAVQLLQEKIASPDRMLQARTPAFTVMSEGSVGVPPA
jgi:LacI family transcriptional regulator